MSVEIQGIKELEAKFDTLLKGKALENAVENACAIVERAAKQKAPKGRTGELRRLIQSKVDKNGNEIVGTIFNPLEYAPYVEYGTGLFAEKGGRKDVPWAYEDEATGELIWTSGQHPQPYMRPALDENREEIKKIIKGGILDD